MLGERSGRSRRDSNVAGIPSDVGRIRPDVARVSAEHGSALPRVENAT